jgi:hypothetical protein
MVLMAVLGAAVLAMVSWVALREAQRQPGSFPTRRRTKAAVVPVPPSAPSSVPSPAPTSNGVAPTSTTGVEVVGDAAIADADTAEALAAAAALWHLLVDAERD